MPRHEFESWLGLMREVASLLVPLVFGRAHANLTLSEGGPVARTTVSSEEEWDGVWRAAASKVVMRSGCHFARFTLEQGVGVYFSVHRPDWNVEGGHSAFEEDGHSSTARGTETASPAPTTGSGSRPRGSRATASACCSTSTKAA